MNRLFLLICTTLPGLALATISQAAQNWETCLDKADFSFNAEELRLISNSYTVTKAGCTIRFLGYGGKGEKFEINLCDSTIHIDRFPAIDSGTPTRLLAGSAGCPAPLFGADFDDNAADLQEYRAAKQRVFEIFEIIKGVYEKESSHEPKNPTEMHSSEKFSCGNFLLKEYLGKCIAFEAKKTPDPKSVTKDTSPSNIPGVHPQTIIAPKK